MQLNNDKKKFFTIILAILAGIATVVLLLTALESNAAPADNETPPKATQKTKVKASTSDAEERKAESRNLQKMFGGEKQAQALPEKPAEPKQTKADDSKPKESSAPEKSEAGAEASPAAAPAPAHTPEKQKQAVTLDATTITLPVPLMNEEQEKLARLRLLNLDVQIQEKERKLQELKNATTALKPKKQRRIKSAKKRMPLPSVLSIQGIGEQLTATLRYSSTHQTQTVSKGDKVGRARVTKITPNSVVLSSGTTLRFKE